MQLDSVPFLRSDSTWKQRPFGSVLFRAGHRHKVYLNAGATRMVALIDGEHTAAAIALSLASQHRLPVERCQQDVATLFGRLAHGGWLTDNPGLGKPADSGEVRPSLDFISLAVTHRCNLRCRYCYIELTERADGELTTSQWLETIRQLQPFKLMGVILTGGEPLLREDFWTVVEAINAAHMEVILCTNGLLIDSAFVERAKSAKFASIQVGMDGASAVQHEQMRGQGTFPGAWENVLRLHEAGLPVELLCTVARPTFESYIDVVKLARQHGLAVSLNEYLPLGPSRAHRGALELTVEQLFQMRSNVSTLSYAGVLHKEVREGETFKRSTGAPEQEQPAQWERVTSCLGRDSGAHIQPNGDVLICQMLNWPDLVGGNVTRQPLREIWERSPVFETLRATGVDQYAACRACSNRYLCGGTCRAITIADSGCFTGLPNSARCLWDQLYYARLSRVLYDTTEPFQAVLEREKLLC